MSKVPYEAPLLGKTAFNCPHCSAYSEQRMDFLNVVTASGIGLGQFKELVRRTCNHCEKYTLWHEGKLIYPADSGAPPPNSDLGMDIQTDYLEAKSIVTRSPRGAAALLRLCIQKLCVQLGGKGKNIDDDIAGLVQNGLPVKIQQALDIVRVIGNHSVHPGQIDLTDQPETAMQLFDLVNIIADVMITQPKHIQSVYESLPEPARKAIEKRDGSKGS